MTASLSSLPDFRRLWFVGLVSFVVRWLEMLAIALYSYAFYLAMVIGFALAPVAAIAGVFLLLAGIGAVGFAVLQTTLIYRHAPVEMRARLLGGISVAVGMGPLGFLYLGFLAEILSPRTATVAMGAQGLLVMLLTRRYWVAVLKA